MSSRIKFADLVEVNHSGGHVDIVSKGKRRRITNCMTEFDRIKDALIQASPKSSKSFKYTEEVVWAALLTVAGLGLWTYFHFYDPLDFPVDP